MEKEIFVAPRASRSTRNMSVRSRGRTFVETGAFLHHEGEGQKVEFDSLGEFDAFTTTSALYPVADMVEQPSAIDYVDADGRRRRKVIDQVYTLKDGTRIAAEIKPAERARAQNLEEKLGYVAAAMPDDFADYLVLITEENYDQWEALNARRLLAYRREDDPEAAAIITELAVEIDLPVTIRELISKAAIGGRAWPEIFKAIYAGILRPIQDGIIDLDFLVEGGVQ
ncbi:hypothetical protein [Celeribacter baekdonensis]|uniref:hypothetical protein n=1 Tax=Celeribacter baekdonensis TaxID=875171 RepID=UPI0030DA77E9|tara:strand:- start:27269 stop:27946 length:678 start_codon:yes stop_codon:yes gene_type:complete